MAKMSKEEFLKRSSINVREPRETRNVAVMDEEEPAPKKIEPVVQESVQPEVKVDKKQDFLSRQPKIEEPVAEKSDVQQPQKSFWNELHDFLFSPEQNALEKGLQDTFQSIGHGVSGGIDSIRQGFGVQPDFRIDPENGIQSNKPVNYQEEYTKYTGYKPESFPEKALSRGAQMYTGMAGFGQMDPRALYSSLAASTVGQTGEEIGLPPWAQATLEIGTFIATQHKSGKPISSNSEEIQMHLEKLRDAGFSEQDITLAKNALENRGWLKKISQSTSNARKRFQETYKSIETNVDKILSDVFPGIEEGVPAMEEAGSKMFSAMNEMATNVQVKNSQTFISKATEIISRLKETLANTPEEEQVIKLLENAITSSSKEPTANFFTRFYKGLNKIGKWGDPHEREKIFGEVKDAIKTTLREQGPEGQELANAFEEANKYWQKMRYAGDVKDLLGKAVKEGNLDYKHASKLLEKKENLTLLNKSLGEKSSNRLKLLIDTGKDIQGLEKKIDSGLIKTLGNASELLGLARGVMYGDYNAVILSLGAEAGRRFATRMLTDPKFQNMSLKIMDAAKRGKYNPVYELTKLMKQGL